MHHQYLWVDYSWYRFYKASILIISNTGLQMQNWSLTSHNVGSILDLMCFYMCLLNGIVPIHQRWSLKMDQEDLNRTTTNIKSFHNTIKRKVTLTHSSQFVLKKKKCQKSSFSTLVLSLIRRRNPQWLIFQWKEKIMILCLKYLRKKSFLAKFLAHNTVKWNKIFLL